MYSSLLLTNRGNIRALLIPFLCLGRGYLHVLYARFSPEMGKLSVGCDGPGMVFDSACTQLADHQVLSISLQKNSSVLFLHLRCFHFSSSAHRTCLGFCNCFQSSLTALSSAFPLFPLHRDQTGLERQCGFRGRAGPWGPAAWIPNWLFQICELEWVT